jgi:hypothetical protein
VRIRERAKLGRVPKIVTLAILVAAFGGFTVSAARATATATSIVGAAATPSGSGWWTVTAQGAVTAGGTAADLGDLAGTTLNQPIVGMASTPDGDGYWLVASDGGVFAYGDAAFYGSTGGLDLNQPIVGMASTFDGDGYWLVASDGGVFAFGDAAFYGSTGGLRLNQPIVGMASTHDGGGYWLVASDGGIFTFGDAGFRGSAAASGVASPVVGMASTSDGGGYWVLTADGQIYAFGDTTYAGAPDAQSFGVFATPGGGYTVVTGSGGDHYGPASASVESGHLGSAAGATGLASTIGTVTEPQVVRDGDLLREVNPANSERYLDSDFRFTGVDAYELTTDWAVNYGCGPDLSNQQIGQLFSALGPNAVVRVWFFQQLATNKYTGARDWTGLDRVVDLADRYGVHIVATLANQDGTCDDGNWLSSSWYAGGYAAPSAGSERVSYQTYVAQVVARYAGNPAILAWEPVNEPRANDCTDTSDCWNSGCPNPDADRDDLKQFFDQIGAEIRSIDPNHLISDGAPPIGSCSAVTWSDFDYVDSSLGIDLMSFHDYSGGAPISAATATAVNAATAADDKPMFAGENGDLNASVQPNPGGSCPTEGPRAQSYQIKITDELSDMPAFAGWLFWNAGAPPGPGSDPTACNFGTWAGDPLLQVLSSIGSGLAANG